MITLVRVDKNQNMRRFYGIGVGRTLWGELCVVRVHGRIGGAQRFLPPVVCVDDGALVAYVDGLVGQKLRKGYRLER